MLLLGNELQCLIPASSQPHPSLIPSLRACAAPPSWGRGAPAALGALLSLLGTKPGWLWCCHQLLAAPPAPSPVCALGELVGCLGSRKCPAGAVRAGETSPPHPVRSRSCRIPSRHPSLLPSIPPSIPPPHPGAPVPPSPIPSLVLCQLLCAGLETNQELNQALNQELNQALDQTRP